MEKKSRGCVLFLISLSFFLLVGISACCENGPTRVNQETSAEDDDQSDDDSFDDEQSAYNVLERYDPDRLQDQDDPGADIDDYQTFVQLAREYADPISVKDIRRQLNEIAAGAVEIIPSLDPGDNLGETIAEVLNIGFLLERINERLLVVTAIEITETKDYVERHLLFEDPWVGVFEGYLLTPNGDGPFPGVVAIHGHFEDAAAYRDNYHGIEYPINGHAILMLTMRAMDNDAYERDISLELLTNGFTLMGLRAYETLLGVKYLRYLSTVDEKRIGLIGHSGGSAACNLTVRLDAGIGAYVSDMVSEYAEWWPDQDFIHCETIPELYPYHELVNDFSTGITPILTVPYAYENSMEEIFSFFDETLN